MAVFPNFAALKAAIQDDAIDTTASFLAALPRFVAQAEQRIYSGGRPPLPSEPIRIRALEQSGTIALVDGEANLPTGWLEFKRLAWLSDLRSVPSFIPPDEFHLRRGTATAGAPTLYTIEGGKILVSPKVSGDLSVTYYKTLTPLVADADTNWLLENAPEVYLQACLMYAYRWKRDRERATEAFGDYVSAAGALNDADVDGMHSGNTLAPMLRRVV